jgi:hypothetical protein
VRLPTALLVGLLLGGMLSLGGCGPPIPPEELGTVLDDVPEFPEETEVARPPESNPDEPAGAVDQPQSTQ